MTTSLIPRYDTIIVDIGDVLYTWSANPHPRVSPRILKNMLTSSTWGQYECGKISEAECYKQVAADQGVSVSDIAQVVRGIRDSLLPNADLFAFISALKRRLGGKLRVFAMSNISHPDYEALRAKQSADWSIFDYVFTSAAAGMRKPGLGFYKDVIRQTSCNPATTIFVDDKAENVLSARSFGIHGVVYDSLSNVCATLRRLIWDPTQRGWEYLRRHAGEHKSVTNTGSNVADNISQLLLLEATNDRGLVDLTYFASCGKEYPSKASTLEPILPSDLPHDPDTISLALTILGDRREDIDCVMNEMLQYCDDNAVVVTSFDRHQVRIDPVVCVSVLTLFYVRGREAELSATADWILAVLFHRAYLDGPGTQRYASPECFLYFLARLLATASEDKFTRRVRPLVVERLQERVGFPSEPIALAMRIIACAKLGHRDLADLALLLSMQHDDGSWGPGELRRHGPLDGTIGNFGLATALALQAIGALST